MQDVDYDCIFSLGGCCNAAAQLRRRGLRHFSTPLDWLAIDRDDRAIRYLPEGFRTRFADFCRKENLRPRERTENAWAPYCYDDVHSGFMFIHHFFRPVDDSAGYEEVMNTFRRRFDRMFSTIESSSSVLFILQTWFSYDPDLVDPLYRALTEIWPDKRIALRVMQFAAQDNEEQKDRWGGGGLYRFKRRCNEYDFAETNWEWSFLDAFVRARGSKCRPRGFDRLVYKLCRSFHKYLTRKGYDTDFKRRSR